MLNKTILMGRLTADPELRKTQNGTSVTSFTLAVNRYAKQGEQQQADFIDIVAWSATADFVCKWFRKGMQVAVAGRLQTRMWEDKQGNKRKAVEVVAEEVHFAEPKRENSGNQNYGNQGYNAPSFPAGVPVEFDMAEVDDDGDLPF